MSHFVSKLQSSLKRSAAQVQISVLRSKLLTAVCILLNCERRGNSCVKNSYIFKLDLNLTCLYLVVFALSLNNNTFSLNNPLSTHLLHKVVHLLVVLISYKLCNTIAVSQINEIKRTHFAYSLYPSGQSNLLAYIRNAKLSASVCSVHICRILIFFSLYTAHRQTNLQK